MMKGLGGTQSPLLRTNLEIELGQEHFWVRKDDSDWAACLSHNRGIKWCFSNLVSYCDLRARSGMCMKFVAFLTRVLFRYTL